MNRPIPTPVLLLVMWVGLLAFLCFGLHATDAKGEQVGMYAESSSLAPLAAVGLKRAVRWEPSSNNEFVPFVTYEPNGLGFVAWAAAGGLAAWLWGRRARST